MNLRDKLRAAQPLAKRPEKPAPEACYRRREVFPALSVPGAGKLCADILRAIGGEKDYEDAALSDILFLDTETTGLSGGAGTLAFLTGLGYFDGDSFVVEQCLMRDYDEEALMLSDVIRRMNHFKLLVTYNGATFDLPLLRSRCVMNRLRLPELAHLDLLPAARRVFKMRLGRCPLSALEEYVLGEPRESDLPGAEAPARFFQYLKDQDFSGLEDVLIHNARDILALAKVTFRITLLHDEPLSARYDEDIYSLGKTLQKRGYTEKARQCYRALDKGRMAKLSQLGLAESYRRAGEYALAAKVYERMIARGLGGGECYIALAKLYEHRLKDTGEALRIASLGLARAADTDMTEDLSRRLGRLIRKRRKETCSRD